MVPNYCQYGSNIISFTENQDYILHAKMLIEIDIAELNLQMQLSIIEKQFNLI